MLVDDVSKFRCTDLGRGRMLVEDVSVFRFIDLGRGRMLGVSRCGAHAAAEPLVRVSDPMRGVF